MRQETILEFGEFQGVGVGQPTTSAELGQTVREAAAQGHAVFPLGGRTMLGLGYPPSKSGVAIDLRGLDQVIDYPARDMTITVQAGITIAKLQALLDAENQQLPVDVPMPEQATLGGAIAVNASGPRRYGYGTLRDYLIGINFMNDQGQEVKAGGRVVKNVAGYDLMKLHIGALGTLGIVTQVTLKLRPRPEGSSSLVFDCSGHDLPDVLDKLHSSATRPVCIEVWTMESGAYQVLVGFDGNREAVEWQIRALNQPGAHATGSTNPVACASGWCDTHRFSFKATTLASNVAWFLSLLNAISIPFSHAHAGNGIVYGHLDDLTLDQARTMLTTLLEAAGPEGNVVVLKCPTDWKRELPIWGKPRGDWALMRRVKEALDPCGIFNPGRFVDGI
jgi:glycolate oxidase FAD binding subunit